MSAYGGTPFDPANYDRYIEILDSDVTTQVAVLSNLSDSLKYVPKMEFELLRQGGCGAGEIVISRAFPYQTIDLGMYVRCRMKSGGRNLYLGRIVEIDEETPAGVTCRLEGPFSLTNDMQCGGFDSEDLRLPHLYAASDFFVWDPDKNLQSWDFVATIPGLIQKLYDQYISVKSHIQLGDIGPFPDVIPWGTAIFRGQENISSVIRTLAVQQLGACYGVDADNKFFFTQRVADLSGNEMAYFREGVHLTKMRKHKDLSMVFNKLIITGDYVYNLISGYKMYRWVSSHADLDSILQYGDKKITLYIPWIRSNMDAKNFANGFFRDFANATTKYDCETIGQGDFFAPWEGLVGLQYANGSDIVRHAYFDRLKVQFNEVPKLEFTTGPEDLQFPVAPDPQRWELAPTGQDAWPDFPDFGSSSAHHGGSTGGGSSEEGSGSGSGGGSGPASDVDSGGSSAGSQSSHPREWRWVRIVDNGGAKNVTALAVFVDYPFDPFGGAGQEVTWDGTGDPVVVGNPRNNWLEEDQIYWASKLNGRWYVDNQAAFDA